MLSKTAWALKEGKHTVTKLSIAGKSRLKHNKSQCSCHCCLPLWDETLSIRSGAPAYSARIRLSQRVIHCRVSGIVLFFLQVRRLVLVKQNSWDLCSLCASCCPCNLGQSHLNFVPPFCQMQNGENSSESCPCITYL